MSEKTKELNRQIMDAERRLSKIDDYFQAIEATVPLLKLLVRLSGRADLDSGKDKKSWSLALGDALTIKQDVSDRYSDTADIINELKNGIEQEKK